MSVMVTSGTTARVSGELDLGQQALDSARCILALLPDEEFAFAVVKADIHVYSEGTLEKVAAGWGVTPRWTEDGTQYRAEKRITPYAVASAVYILPKPDLVPVQAETKAAA